MPRDIGANGANDFEFGKLLDLDQAVLGFGGSLDGVPSALEPPQGVCPSHAGADDSSCHGFMGDCMRDWDPAATASDPNPTLQTGPEEPEYSKFENWIPRFVRPEKPCDYCKFKRLDCYLQRGEAHCNPCRSLFRECSFANSHTLESRNYVEKHTGAFLDTLHAVDENSCKEQVTLTRIKPLRSKEGHGSGTSTPVRGDDAAGSSKRNGLRFPRHAVKTLRDWLESHAEHPYPTEEEKVELERRTDLRPSQIANWLANARRRKKVTDRPKLHMSPSLRPTTPALPIPGAAEKPWEELNPFERWQHSPPEHEPASITDIALAVAHTDLPDESGSTSPSSAGRRKRSSNGSGFSNFRAPSTTSLHTSAAQSSSKSASSAAFSQGSSHSHGSFASFNSSLAGKRDRRRRRRPAPNAIRKTSDDKRRIFQCSFCTDTFKSKYDWTRHEKSLHLSLEKWICHPLGPAIAEPGTNAKRCVYCGAQDPSDDHIESHNHRQCEDKGLDARTFYRKDHLRQHLRLMHDCEMTSFMELWKSSAVHINSRCGFCAQRFTVWQERIDHITAHFKAGVRMSEWKGCRGLDPAVAAQVTNAMPPYLIGIEAVSPNPFSATNRASWRQLPSEDGRDLEKHRPDKLSSRISNAKFENSGYGSKATCWEILTVRLGRFANDMARKGVVLSDEMLQQQARQILYDSDDTWNQTAADNPEWLDLFKKAHGVDFIPTAVGGQGTHIPEDLEMYGDLGLRIPFAVQLQAYNLNQAEGQEDPTNMPPVAYKEALASRAHFKDFYAQIFKQGKLHDENFNCGHEECRYNMADISWLDGFGDGLNPRHRRWCKRELPADLLRTYANDGLLPQNIYMMEPAQGDCWRHDSGASSSDNLASSRARSLEALARLEAPLLDNADHSPNQAREKDYLQRHRLVLPPEKARQFATTAGAWVDSGIMPEAVQTGDTGFLLGNPATSTGAMMEFLGGDMDGTLPLSNDANTSTIPLQAAGGKVDWMAAGGVPMDEATLMHDLDDLIAATTAPQDLPSQSAPTWDTSMLLPTSGFAGSNEMSLGMTSAAPAFTEDMDLDFGDMIFDTAFDMSLDEVDTTHGY